MQTKGIRDLEATSTVRIHRKALGAEGIWNHSRARNYDRQGAATVAVPLDVDQGYSFEQPSPTHAGRRRPRVFILALCALLVLTGIALAPVSSLPRHAFAYGWHSAERAWLIATDRLVDVGGYRLRIDCRGHGNVSVVMEAGLCQTRDTWDKVVGDVASFARVCVYDRAGLGESDPSKGPRTPGGVVEDLHRLLAAADVRPPYVLVGHSFGGLAVRLYAERHPERVRGLVLVDAAHEAQFARISELVEPQDRVAFLGHEGGGNCERLDLLAATTELEAAGPLPAVPLVVLTARPPWNIAGCPIHAVNAELQRQLARLSVKGRQVIAERSNHFIQRDRPDLVTAAIRDLAGG